MKMLTIPTALCSGVFVVSLLTVGFIETAALSQPSIADSVFRHPHQVKSGIHFFTDWQEHIYSIAYPTMFGALVPVAILGHALNQLRDRLEQDIKRRKMDKIVASFEQSS